MHEQLFQTFNQIIPLSPQQREELRRVTYLLDLPQGSLLLERGQICNHLHFILEGVVRAVHYDNWKEVIPWFGFEGDIVNSHLSFTYRQPSLESIILSSDCKFLSITYESLQYLYSKDPIWQNLSRVFIERYYIDVQDRLISFLSLTAYERYEQLLQKYPDIEDRVNLGHIASYLGIRQETLSNLRKRRRRHQRNHGKPN
ncbi:Crp/Fnr family transcriptional regulator [Microcoleus sp. POL10_C6]|jgi:CRP/FNR family transcriptional regulator, anaerobic regulatory protein|uniref:Crp/Fnr family transcriptional regulator n=1 Tax=unclassified Microcoleus TaxID=2642155 RepID=UPI002FD315B5